MRNAVQDVVLNKCEPPDVRPIIQSNLTLNADKRTVWTAFKRSLFMLRPDLQKKNPAVFLVEIAALLALAGVIHAAFGSPRPDTLSSLIWLDVWLFVMVIAANFVTVLSESPLQAADESIPD